MVFKGLALANGCAQRSVGMPRGIHASKGQVHPWQFEDSDAYNLVEFRGGGVSQIAGGTPTGNDKTDHLLRITRIVKEP